MTTYHDNAVCGSCGGKLESSRDAICESCSPEWFEIVDLAIAEVTEE